MLELIFQSRAAIQNALVLLALLVTFRIGAWPERLCAGSVALMTLIDLAYHSIFSGGYSNGSSYFFHLGLDLAGLAAILAIALQANRIYPLWLTAFQLISVLVHLVREIDPAVQPNAYVMLYVLPYYAMIIILLSGTLNHWRRVRTVGPYRSWRISSHLET